jgi:hypothetical protein
MRPPSPDRRAVRTRCRCEPEYPLAKSKSGEKYAVIAEISGLLGAPEVKNFRIFHQQKATVMLQVAPGDVQSRRAPLLRRQALDQGRFAPKLSS